MEGSELLPVGPRPVPVLPAIVKEAAEAFDRIAERHDNVLIRCTRADVRMHNMALVRVLNTSTRLCLVRIDFACGAVIHEVDERRRANLWDEDVARKAAVGCNVRHRSNAIAKISRGNVAMRPSFLQYTHAILNLLRLKFGVRTSTNACFGHQPSHHTTKGDEVLAAAKRDAGSSQHSHVDGRDLARRYHDRLVHHL